ncbi:LysR family transcriptional regulator [Paenibacillus kyungheensis]|uniref:LysR family transcriptional regulator n=1 Tax=Paenibacillus kyungheensis TaxID=1452732 RepID=A0AAX3LZ67_9BACL|nr:LysR family transcriptional regulator [Paenibacillus kyungheensis]WCT55204.1 LysR family transcriptional regulator [Paenibacillus kyungheensis]
MELLYLKTFCELVKWGNYTRTAQVLDYAQSSVTNHIQRLEQLYGGKRLFQRKGNTVILTPIGEKLLPYARQMIDLQQQARQALSIEDLEPSVLTIGTIESLSLYYLPGIMAQFRQQYPHVQVKIVLDQEQQLIRRLREQELDIALILDTPYQARDITSIPLFSVEMKVVIYPEHALAQRSSISAGDLHQQPLILTEEGCTYRAYLIQKMKEQQQISQIYLELGNIESIKQAVAKQWGIAFLPQFVLHQEEAYSGLHILPWKEEDLQLYSQILYHAERPLSSIAADWVTLCRANPTVAVL